MAYESPGKGERGLQYPFLTSIPASFSFGHLPGGPLAGFSSSVHHRLSIFRPLRGSRVPDGENHRSNPYTPDAGLKLRLFLI